MRWISLACSFAALVAAAAPALAQDISPDLAKLHDDLHLSQDQERSWDAYVAAIRPTADMMARRQATQDLLPMVPTPRRIALLQANMEKDAADLRRQGAAVIAFYNQLTPNQQRTFDMDTLPGAQGGTPSRAPTSAPRGPSQPRVVTPPPAGSMP